MFKKTVPGEIEKYECKKEEPTLHMPKPLRFFDVKKFEEAFLKREIEAKSQKENDNVPGSDISSSGSSSQVKGLNPNAPPFDPTLIEIAFPCPIVPQLLSSLDYSGNKAIGNHKNGSNLRVFQNLKK